MFLICKTWDPLRKVALCQFWLKSAQWLCRIRFIYFTNIFSLQYILFFYPLGKRASSFTWTNLNPLHPRTFCLSLVKLEQVVLKMKIFRYRQCIYAMSLSSVCPFLWTKLNPYPPRMRCAKLDWSKG